MKTLFFFLSVVSFSAHAHTEKLEVIEVTHGKEESSLSSFIPSASVLKEKELLRRRETTLGDTLQNEVGIQSSNFGPVAGRPVIRGLDGNRIRVLQNGLGTLDASAQSIDHAVPIDTLTIDKVEVVRGPMSLLYGSSAVGGVVNIVNNRIHREYTEGAITQFDVRGESVNNSLSLSNRIDYGVGKWMFHFDGSLQNMGDTEIPRYTNSDRRRSRNPTDPEPRDEIPNSFSQQSSLAFGASRIFDRGHLGLSYYRFDNDYGSITEEDVMIRMVQNRIELSSECRPENGSVRAYRVRSAQSFYKHEEFEGDEVGTTFKNSGNETRLEVHTESGKVSGVSGLQTQINTFKAIGDEAFLPESDNLSVALFSLQKLSVSEPGTLELGARIESTQSDRKASDLGGKTDHQFTGMNGSLGYQHDLKKDHTLNASYSYTQRAPTFQELYSNGNHVATGQVERGSTSLDEEKAHALELSYKKDSAASFFTFAVYTQWFDDYILLSPTGENDASADNNPIFQYRQENARIYGAELESREELSHETLGGSWWGITKADITRGTGQGGDDLPRMPAPRLSFGVQYLKDRWEVDLEAQHYFDQTHTAENELKTDSFTMLNFGLIYEIPKASQNYRFYFRVKNITDEEGRLATAFTKDRAPLPGRNFLAGFQTLF